MKISYYPGCSLHSAGIEYDLSAKKVCEALSIELVEIEDWICCGSSPAHQSDEIMSIALPLKNIALMKEKDNLQEICVPCASCYSRLKFAQERIKDKNLKQKIEKIIGSNKFNNVTVIHMLDLIIKKTGLDLIKNKANKGLKGIRVASYYGCLITRPPDITGKKHFENPREMESILEAIGAEPIDWNLKTFCCGASFALTDIEIMLELTKKILDDAVSAGAEAISVGCPLCHANLDTRQKEINKKFNTDFNIPIFYFTELMGLSFGFYPEVLGLNRHITDTMGFLKRRKII